MKVREFITLLAEIGAHADIREFDIQAYDAEDERWRDVTGVIVSPHRKTVVIHTDDI